MTKTERDELRPTWWPAWTDYPHGPLEQTKARELSRYCVALEAALDAADKALREITSYIPVITDMDGIKVCNINEVFELKRIARLADRGEGE